jgi:hypothetical protein
LSPERNTEKISPN